MVLISQGYIMDTWNRICKLRPQNEAPDTEKNNVIESNHFDDFITDMYGGSLYESISTDFSTFVQQLASFQSADFQIFRYATNTASLHYIEEKHGEFRDFYL